MLSRSLTLAILLLFGAHARAGILARFELDFGTMDVELYDVDKPATVRNFLDYEKSGVWNPSIMHRWVTNFVIQGGAYTYDPTNGAGTITTRAPVTNEYSVGPKLSNVYGTIAMARASGQTNSATTSWYFNVSDNIFLDNVDGGFTVFGKLLRGTNVLNRFKPPAGTTNIWFASANSALPVYVTNEVADYVYVGVDLLKAKIDLVSSGKRISWNSVEGLPNIVDYSTNFPPAWIPLETNLGTGLTMSVTNNTRADPRRQYRVRVDYSNTH